MRGTYPYLRSEVLEGSPKKYLKAFVESYSCGGGGNNKLLVSSAASSVLVGASAAVIDIPESAAAYNSPLLDNSGSTTAVVEAEVVRRHALSIVQVRE